MMLMISAAAAVDDVPELSHTLTRLEKPVAAPDFTLLDMDEKSYSLKDYRGKYVLLNFWATWCPPCRREMPSMESLHQTFADSKLVVLAVNEYEDPDHVFSYMGELDVFPTFPILFDTDSKVSELYEVRGLPTSFIINPQGQVIYRAVGGREFDHPDIMKLIRSLP